MVEGGGRGGEGGGASRSRNEVSINIAWRNWVTLYFTFGELSLSFRRKLLYCTIGQGFFSL